MVLGVLGDGLFESRPEAVAVVDVGGLDVGGRLAEVVEREALAGPGVKVFIGAQVAFLCDQALQGWCVGCVWVWGWGQRSNSVRSGDNATPLNHNM